MICRIGTLFVLFTVFSKGFTETCLGELYRLPDNRIKCFWLTTTKATATIGQDRCAKDGGYLATLDNAEVSSFIKNDLHDPLPDDMGIWTGIKSSDNMKTWTTWLGDAVPWTNWGSNHPDGKGPCVGLFKSSMLWDNHSCNNIEHIALCEKFVELTTTQESTTSTPTIPTTTELRTTQEQSMGDTSTVSSTSEQQTSDSLISSTTSVVTKEQQERTSTEESFTETSIIHLTTEQEATSDKLPEETSSLSSISEQLSSTTSLTDKDKQEEATMDESSSETSLTHLTTEREATSDKVEDETSSVPGVSEQINITSLTTEDKQEETTTDKSADVTSKTQVPTEQETGTETIIGDLPSTDMSLAKVLTEKWTSVETTGQSTTTLQSTSQAWITAARSTGENKLTDWNTTDVNTTPADMSWGMNNASRETHRPRCRKRGFYGKAEIDKSSADGSRRCECHHTSVSIEQKLYNLKKDLKLDKRVLKKFQRRFKSAEDDRLSVFVTGLSFVSVVFMCCLVLMVSDILRFKDLYPVKSGGRYLKKPR